jgi:hypothetical protein
MKELKYKDERKMLDNLDELARKRKIKILEIIVRYEEE